MIFSSIFNFFKPENTDLADIGNWFGANAQISENASKNGIALQTNTSTTAYFSTFPIRDYVNGHSFVFIPLFTCTGASTININGKGVKKLFNQAGDTQLSIKTDLQAYNPYLLVYDSSIELGVFRCTLLNRVATKKGNQTHVGTLTASQVLTINIPLGSSNYIKGKAVIGDKIKVDFTNANTDSMVCGSYVSIDLGGIPTYKGLAWTRAGIGTITQGFLSVGESSFGYWAVGDREVQINECYINGSNLTIELKNTDTSTAHDCGFTIYWEVST